MVNACFMEFDIDMMKNDHMFETALDKLEIAITELTNLKEQGFFTESELDDEGSIYEEAVGEFLDKVKEFFKNIIDSIKKLVAAAQEKMRLEMTKREVNKKLQRVKACMANRKSVDLNGKVKMFDTAKYIREYTKYINLYVSETKKLYSKEYKSVEEYEKAVKACNKKLADFIDSSKLYNNEIWEIEMNVNQAYAYTENELKSWDSVVKAYQDAWIKAVEESEKLAEKEDDKSKIADIKNQTSSFTSKCSSAFKKVINSPVTKVAALAAAVAGIAAGAKTISNKSNKED